MYLSKLKGQTFRFIPVSLIFFIMISFAFPKDSLAYRSRDGGGDIVEFDFGKWAAGAAIGMVSSAVGSAIASGLGNILSSGTGFTDGFTGSFSSLSGIDSWGTNLVNSTAVGQVQNAVGMTGSYYGWDPRSTLLISSIAGGVVGGGLNPGHFGSGVAQTVNGSIGVLNGMGIGLIEGSVEGAILMSAADKKGRVDPLTGALANLAGSLVTGSLSGGLTGPTGEFSFANIGDFNFSGAAQRGLTTALRSIPSAAVSLGVQSITKNMDKQDAAMIKSAFSGAYYIVNTPTNYLVDKKITPNLFGQSSSRQTSSSLPTYHNDGSVSVEIKWQGSK
ncbi:MAG: hypothetical protein ACYDFR_01975 [Candidatus Omnitrophota bacterium]